MIALFSSPSDAASTIRARRASPWAVFRRRAKPSNSRRSASDKVIATAALPTSHPPSTTADHILINFSIRTLVVVQISQGTAKLDCVDDQSIALFPVDAVQHPMAGSSRCTTLSRSSRMAIASHQAPKRHIPIAMSGSRTSRNWLVSACGLRPRPDGSRGAGARLRAQTLVNFGSTFPVMCTSSARAAATAVALGR